MNQLSFAFLLSSSNVLMASENLSEILSRQELENRQAFELQGIRYERKYDFWKITEVVLTTFTEKRCRVIMQNSEKESFQDILEERFSVLSEQAQKDIELGNMIVPENHLRALFIDGQFVDIPIINGRTPFDHINQLLECAGSSLFISLKNVASESIRLLQSFKVREAYLYTEAQLEDIVNAGFFLRHNEFLAQIYYHQFSEGEMKLLEGFNPSYMAGYILKTVIEKLTKHSLPEKGLVISPFEGDPKLRLLRSFEAEKLYIGSIQNPQELEQILELLSRSKNLLKLSLGYSLNASDVDSILGKLISIPTLTSLSVFVKNWEPDVSRSILEKLSRLSHLQELTLDVFGLERPQNLDVFIQKILSLYKNLKKLEVAHSITNRASKEALMNSLRENASTLESVKVFLNDSDMPILGPIIANMKKLSSLTITTDTGHLENWEPILRALETLSNLSFLSLMEDRCTRVEDKAIISRFLDIVPQNPKLPFLFVNGEYVEIDRKKIIYNLEL